LRVVFLGTPEFSVPVLDALITDGHEIVACYTRAPAAAGRGMAERRSPVHLAAEPAGIPVLHPASLRGEEAAAAFRAHRADVAVVVAYGLLLPQSILDLPKHGCLNLHASLLPRWRGAAPIQRAIMAGDRETGVMVMKMEAGLDTGPVGMTARVAIASQATAGDLHDRLSARGAALMAKALAALARGELSFTPQAKDGVTYARKIEKAETRIDWSRSSTEVHDHIRGLSPFPGAWFEAPAEGRAVRVKALRSEPVAANGAPGTLLDRHLTVACASGAVRLTQVQRAGARPMEADEFLRGTKLEARSVLA
jgi:methionyl-tRNA formyltransferase